MESLECIAAWAFVLPPDILRLGVDVIFTAVNFRKPTGM
jgi:hypothetical protein